MFTMTNGIGAIKERKFMQSINITSKAKEYILKSGDTITLEPIHARLC